MFELTTFTFIGALNVFVDLLVFSTLALSEGLGANGGLFVIFKSFSFLIAAINSYLLTKYWVFRARPHAHRHESLLVAIVTAGGYVCNVGIAFVVCATLMTFAAVPLLQASIISALVGAVVVFFVSFLVYNAHLESSFVGRFFERVAPARPPTGEVKDTGVLKNVIAGNVLLVTVCVLTLTVSIYHATFVKWMDHAGLIPKSETYTEIFFNDSDRLPTSTVKDQPMTFSFTIHPVTNVEVDVPYRVYFQPDVGFPESIRAGTLRFQPGDSRQVPVYYIPRQTKLRGKVVVELPAAGQQIYFLLGYN